jgi:hypothetical protein
MEPMSKMVLSLTGILLAFEIFPKLYIFVPFGSIKPTTKAAFDLLTILLKTNSLTLGDNVLNGILVDRFVKSALDILLVELEREKTDDEDNEKTKIVANNPANKNTIFIDWNLT